MTARQSGDSREKLSKSVRQRRGETSN